MTPDSFSYSYAFMLGLLSSAHCVGMCGGISSALSVGISAPHQPLRFITLTLHYNIGRIITYTLLGFSLGSLMALLGEYWPIMTIVMRVAAGIILIIMGFYLTNLWHGLIWIEKIGQHLWRIVSPLSKKCLPIKQPHQAIFLGLIWGFLPCGLVYSMLIWAASTRDASQSAILMFCFGLGTLPALITLGVFSTLLKKWVQSRTTRTVAGFLVIIFGIWTLWVAMLSSHAHTAPHNHTEHHQH